MKQCPRCGAEHADDLTFCSADGTPLEVVPREPSGSDPARSEALSQGLVPPSGRIATAAGAAMPRTVAGPNLEVALRHSGRAADAAGTAARSGLSPVAVALMMVAVVLAIAVGVWIGRGAAPAAGGTAASPPPASDVLPDAGGGPGPPAPVSPDDNAYLVYADSPGDGFLALRSAPSVSRGARTGQIPHGVGAEVLDGNGPSDQIDGVRGRWIQVDSPVGAGWVFDGFTTTQDVGRSASTVDEGRWATVNGPSDGALNLRTGPDNTTRVVTVMRRGDRVYVPFCYRDVVVSGSGYPGRWCRARLERGATQIGWAFDAFLDGVGS